jgi:Pvc16 N-terminal domain
MSNYLAIATVTAALGRIVHAAAEASGVGSVSLDFGRPTAAGDGQTARKVHIYLYQVSPNASVRNSDLPTRGGDGKLVDRPQAALDLRYLIAFYGSQQTLEPDRMLGAAVRNLHARPLLSRKSIQDAITNHSELTGSNLADAIERVRFTPAAISLDELSKLWSVFFQTPHALSVVYDANVVLIEAEESGPSALPVLTRGQEDRGVETVPDTRSPFPSLDRIHIGVPEDTGVEPLPRSHPGAQLGVYLILRGSNFTGDTVEVEFSHSRFSELNHPQFLASKKITVPLTDRTATEVRVSMPNDVAAQTEWRAGLYTVSVVVIAGGKTHITNKLPLLLAPKITKISPDNPIQRDANKNVTLTITCGPQVLPEQRVSLLVSDREVAAKPHAAATDTTQFKVEDAPVIKDAVVRLRVDGVDSLPFKRVDMPPPTKFEFDPNQKVTIT